MRRMDGELSRRCRMDGIVGGEVSEGAIKVGKVCQGGREDGVIETRRLWRLKRVLLCRSLVWSVQAGEGHGSSINAVHPIVGHASEARSSVSVAGGLEEV